MLNTILWYHDNSALFVEFLGAYSLEDYVQVSHKVRDCYLEFQREAIDIIIDFRAIDLKATDILPLEPLENLGEHPMSKRLCFLADESLTCTLMQLKALRMKSEILILPHLQAVDNFIRA